MAKRRNQQAIEQENETSYDHTARPIWEIVAEIGAKVPSKEWEKLPKDLARNIDHYLYGAPKEEE